MDDLIAPNPIPIPRPILPARPGGSGPAFDFSKLDLGAMRRRRAEVFRRVESLKAPITRVVAVPRAIALGGRPRVVSELRLRHLAEMQAYLEEAEPNPLDLIPPAWADPEPWTRMARLAIAWEASATWPARLGTDRAAEILAAPAGRAFFLAMCLREHDPSIGVADALELLPDVLPVEWSRLMRVAYAIHPRAEIAAEVAPLRQPATPADWCRSAHLAAGERAASIYPRLGELTLSQWANVCSGGKAVEFSTAWEPMLKRARAALENDHVGR